MGFKLCKIKKKKSNWKVRKKFYFVHSYYPKSSKIILGVTFMVKSFQDIIKTIFMGFNSIQRKVKNDGKEIFFKILIKYEFK